MACELLAGPLAEGIWGRTRVPSGPSAIDGGLDREHKTSSRPLGDCRLVFLYSFPSRLAVGGNLGHLDFCKIPIDFAYPLVSCLELLPGFRLSPFCQVRDNFVDPRALLCFHFRSSLGTFPVNIAAPGSINSLLELSRQTYRKTSFSKPVKMPAAGVSMRTLRAYSKYGSNVCIPDAVSPLD